MTWQLEAQNRTQRNCQCDKPKMGLRSLIHLLCSIHTISSLSGVVPWYAHACSCPIQFIPQISPRTKYLHQVLLLVLVTFTFTIDLNLCLLVLVSLVAARTTRTYESLSNGIAHNSFTRRITPQVYLVDSITSLEKICLEIHSR